MSRFEETVAKIAASPVKLALFAQIPGLLAKEGMSIPGGMGDDVAQKAPGIFGRIFGNGKDITGAQTVARNIASGVGQAAAIGGGGYAIGNALDRFDGTDDQLSAERSQIGKLRGEQTYRHGLLSKLQPLHSQVFTEIQSDPVIAKADPQMISSSFETMKRFAPHLAADSNAVRSFLRENAMYGTGPSYASLKNLADAEQSVGKASGMGG